MISSSIHQELARHRHADLVREADMARLAARVPRRQIRSILTLTQPLALLEALSFLGRAKKPQPA